jgi:hypothetical protein
MFGYSKTEAKNGYIDKSRLVTGCSTGGGLNSKVIITNIDQSRLVTGSSPYKLEESSMPNGGVQAQAYNQKGEYKYCKRKEMLVNKIKYYTNLRDTGPKTSRKDIPSRAKAGAPKQKSFDASF